MPRAFLPAAIRVGAALGLVVGFAFPANGQTTIFNSNGFDTGYATGNIFGQQGFVPEPLFTSAGVIQNTTTFSGTQAFQVVGQSLQNNTPFQGGNFWFRSSSFATAYQPTGPGGQGTPFVQVSFQSRTSGAVQLNTDIPFAGVYLEGYTASGQQQAITPVFVNLNGGVTVFTTSAAGGSNKAVSTADGLLPREAWNSLSAELNFTTQTFRVYKQGEATPLTFISPTLGSIVDVPFRNSDLGLTTTRIAEVGMLGFYSFDPFSGTPVQPMNNFYIDNYMVTASATSAAPVPEPGLLLAVGAAGLAGCRVYRRRRAAAAASPQV
jgi:hypothetical protein